MANSSTSLRFGIILDPPLCTNCALKEECAKRGLAFDSALLICKILSLNCTFEWSGSYEYGGLDESGNWTGLIKDLINKRYDISLPAFSPTYQRSEVLDFSLVYFYADTVLATRMPDENNGNVEWSLLHSFEWPVLCLFIFSLLSTSALVAWIYRFRDGGQFVLPDDTYFHKYHPLGDRLAFVTYVFMQFMLSCTYTGVTFSNTMQPRADVPFEGVPSLIDCIERHECTLIAPTLSYSALKWLLDQGDHSFESPNRLSRALATNPIIIEDLDNITGSILTNRDNYLVLIIPKPIFMVYVDYNKDCRFHLTSVPFMEMNAFPLPKHARKLFKRKLDDMAVFFQEYGISAAMESRYRLKMDVCEAKQFFEPAKSVLKIQETYEAIIIFATGIGVACAVFFCEMLKTTAKKYEVRKKV